ncbi:MAG: ExbD/TolR family protein [Treponema sp.]
MKNYAKPSKRESSVNITSLIDVIFMLVIFFMIASTFNKTSIPVSLPKSTSESETPVHTIGVTVDSDENLYVNDTPVPENELENKIREAIAGGADKNAMLYCDEDVHLAKVVRVIDAMNGGGVENVAVKTRSAD